MDAGWTRYLLSDYHIPYTLEHGDLWSGQVMVSNENDQTSIYFNDWSDCSWTHPFFSMPFFLEDIEAELEGIPNARDVLINTYLETWNAYEPIDRLKKLYNIVMLIGPLHNAVLYSDYIFPHMEFKWEMEFIFLRHIRKVIKELRHIQEARSI